MTLRMDALGLVVADLSASIAFYRRLGLEFPADAESAPHVETTLPGGIRLMLDTVDVALSLNPDWTPPSGGHRVALAFLCGDAAEVDAVHTDLTGAGYASVLAPFDAPWGQRYATVHDPDGNPVDLFAPLAG